MSCILLRSAQQAKNTELVVSLAVPITVFAFMVIVFFVALKLWSMRHPYQVRTQDGGTQIKTVKPEHVILQNIPSKTLASLEQSEELASKLQVRDAENCSICLEQLYSSDTVFDLQCCHLFHQRCLERWYWSFHHACPLCQSPLTRRIAPDDNV